MSELVKWAAFDITNTGECRTDIDLRVAQVMEKQNQIIDEIEKLQYWSDRVDGELRERKEEDNAQD